MEKEKEMEEEEKSPICVRAKVIGPFEPLPKKGKKKTTMKQGRIHNNPVADGWARAVMQKPLGIQKCDGRTDRPTNRPTN